MQSNNISLMKTNSIPVFVYPYEQQENDQGIDTLVEIIFMVTDRRLWPDLCTPASLSAFIYIYISQARCIQAALWLHPESFMMRSFHWIPIATECDTFLDIWRTLNLTTHVSIFISRQWDQSYQDQHT